MDPRVVIFYLIDYQMSKQMSLIEVIEYNNLVHYWNSHVVPWYERNEHLAELRKKKHKPEFWLHSEPKQLQLFER